MLFFLCTASFWLALPGSRLLALDFVDSLLGFKLIFEFEELGRRLAADKHRFHRRAYPTGTFRRWRVIFFEPLQSVLVFSFFLRRPSVHKNLGDVVRIGWPPGQA